MFQKIKRLNNFLFFIQRLVMDFRFFIIIVYLVLFLSSQEGIRKMWRQLFMMISQLLVIVICFSFFSYMAGILGLLISQIIDIMLFFAVLQRFLRGIIYISGDFVNKVDNYEENIMNIVIIYIYIGKVLVNKIGIG